MTGTTTEATRIPSGDGRLATWLTLPTGGRPSTLWSAIPVSESLNNQESHQGSTTEETSNEESMQWQT